MNSDVAQPQQQSCPSCGQEKERPEKPLCEYCYIRGTLGAAKLVLFQAMRDNGNKYCTVEELVELVNAHPNKKHPVKRDAVYKILHRYSRHYEDAKKQKKGYLILKKSIKRKKGQRGRPRVKYKLGANLLKRLEKYEERWKYGLPINIRTKNGDKFRMTLDYNNRANNISIKLRKGEYELYDYLLT